MKMLRSIACGMIGLALLAVSNMAVAAMPTDPGIHMTQPEAADYSVGSFQVLKHADMKCDTPATPVKMIAAKSFPASRSSLMLLTSSTRADHFLDERMRC